VNHAHVQVYLWWKNCYCRIPYQSTLYVTAKSIAVPSAVDPAMRSMHAVQEVGFFYLKTSYFLFGLLATCALLSFNLLLKLVH